MDAVAIPRITWKQFGIWAIGIVATAVTIVVVVYLASWAWRKGQES